jgi:hypothetical protein
MAPAGCLLIGGQIGGILLHAIIAIFALAGLLAHIAERDNLKKGFE